MDINSTINYGNYIVSTFITESPFTQFSVESPNEVYYGHTDPVTGDTYTGSYTLDDSGTITDYGYLITNPNGASLYTYVNLNGNYDDFLYHAYVSYELAKDPAVLEAVNYAVQTGYGQDLADWFDTFPGANPNNPASTVIKAGEGDYYYA